MKFFQKNKNNKNIEKAVSYGSSCLPADKSAKQGFTVIEMIVVAAIFGILTAVLVFNYGDFTDRVLATNMAYEIALTTRQAQVFGLGSRGSGGDFSEAYGIFVHVDEDDGSKTLAFFRDSDDDRLCDGDGDYCVCASTAADECLEQLTLQRNIRIESMSGMVSGSCSGITNLSVTFKRPNPDAIFKNHDNTSIVYELAEIAIRAPRSEELRYVVIRNTGQISVTDTSVCG